MQKPIMYRCTGSCGGVTDAPGKSCSLAGCDKEGEPLKAVEQCDACMTASAKDHGKPHACDCCALL